MKQAIIIKMITKRIKRSCAIIFAFCLNLIFELKFPNVKISVDFKSESTVFEEDKKY